MKKLLWIALAFLPSFCFADRLGSLRSAANVLLTTQAVDVAGVIHSTDSLQVGAVFFVASGTVQGPFYVNGPGATAIFLTISGSTFTTTASSTSMNWVVGHGLVVTSTNGTVGDSGSSPGNLSWVHVWDSSVTVSTFGIVVNGGQTQNTGFNSTGGPGILDVFAGSPYTQNRSLFCVGSGAQANQFCVPNNHYPFAVLGFQAGQLVVGDTAAPGQRIYSFGDPNSYIDLRNGSTMTLNTGTANGRGNIRIQPGGQEEMFFSTLSGAVVLTSFTVISHPASGNGGTGNMAIMASSGNPTYGVGYYDPDFYQLYNSGNGRECIGFRQAGDVAGTTDPGIICRPGGLERLDFGFKSSAGGGTNILSIASNGNFPQGSTATVNGDLIIASGEIESPSIKSAVISGVNLSSGIFFTPTLVTSTSTITSTMSVVLASCTTRGASPTPWITLNMSPAQQAGEWHRIYNVGADSCSIRIAGNATDLIESTGVWRLDAQSQHCYMEALGAGLWGGDCQATPWSVFTTQDDVGSFAVASSSLATQCPIYINTPIALTGFRVNRVTNAGWFSVDIRDVNNKYIVGVSTALTVSGASNYMTGGVTQLAKGWYRLDYTANNTAMTITGSNTAASNKMFCGSVGTLTSGLDLSQFTPTAVTANTSTYPAIDLIFNGGLQGY